MGESLEHRAIRALGTADDTYGASYMTPGGQLVKWHGGDHGLTSAAIGVSEGALLDAGFVRLDASTEPGHVTLSIELCRPLTEIQIRRLVQTPFVRQLDEAFVETVELRGGRYGARGVLFSGTEILPSPSKLASLLREASGFGLQAAEPALPR
jgi:hypothetical protein